MTHFTPLLSLLPLPALLLLIAVLHFTTSPAASYELPWLILTGNTLFIGAVGVAVAGIAWRSYAAAGRIQVLVLGCAVLPFGIGAVLAGALRGMPDGANIAVTIHDTGALASAILHSVAALTLLTGAALEAAPARRKLWLALGYCGATLFIASVAAASLKGVIPPFFTQDAGPTPLRELILGSAGWLFAFSFLVFMGTYIRNREPFLFWYACGLALTAIGLTAFYIHHSVGGPVGWAGRAAKYLGGVYFLASLIVAGRTAQKRGAPFDAALTAPLTSAEEKFRDAFANAAIGFTMSTPDSRCEHANPAYCALTGYGLEELRALELSQLIHPGDYAANMEQNRRMLAGEIPDFKLEIRYVCKGGQPVWVRKSVSLVRGPEGEPRWIVALVEDITGHKLAEAKLQQSEQAALNLAREADAARAELQLIFDASPASVFYKDRENRFVRVNRAFAESMGKAKEELEGRSMLDIYPREQAEAYWRDDKEVMASGQPKLNIVEPMQSAAGERWMQTSKVPCRDAAGNIAGIIGFAVDITDQKRAEEALREFQVQLAADLDAMVRLQRIGALFVHEGDIEPVLAEILDAAIAISGADMGNIQLLDPETGDLRIAAQRGFEQPWLDHWNGVARGQGVCGTALERGERVIVEDIEKSPIFTGVPALEIQLRAGVRAVQSTPLISRTGKMLGMISTHRRTPHRPDERTLRLLDLLARQAADIVESKAAQAAIQVSEGRLRAIVNTAADAIIVTGETGRIESVNPAAERVFGYTAAEMVGHSVSMLMPERHRQAHGDYLRKFPSASAAKTGGIRREVEGQRKDGGIFPADIAVAEWRLEDRRFYTCIMRDTTERKQREQQVQLLLREVNHRTKNLLSVVQAVASQTAASAPAEFAERFSERLQSLAVSQDLLVRSQWRGIGLDALARSQLGHFKDLIDGRINLEGPRVDLTAKAAQSIGMALHELATNAVKYGALSNSSGRVSISWRLDRHAPGGGLFVLSWIESGGPPVVAPARRGFGSTVIRTLPRMEFSAEVALEYAPEGLSWRMSCPAERVLEPASAPEPAML